MLPSSQRFVAQLALYLSGKLAHGGRFEAARQKHRADDTSLDSTTVETLPTAARSPRL